ncbi:MAG: heme o synthase [bacterium]
MNLKGTLKAYYVLAKPGIIYGNLITALAGFFLASDGHIQFGVLLAMAVGTSLVMGSGCVFNNYMDRRIDALMARTKQRALVTKTISKGAALTYGTVLGFLGAAILAYWTNPLAASVAVAGWILYVLVYGIAKRRTVHGTLIGSISGAVPPVIGYVAVSNRLDLAAFLLFLMLVFWQMPHFYGIAMYRLHDYAEAKIPVLPVVKGMRAAKVQSLVYIILFGLAAASPTIYGYTGYIYLAVMAVLSLAWLRVALTDFNGKFDAVWGRKVFRFSLVLITALSVMISIGGILP